jgi:type III restriction enzyme
MDEVTDDGLDALANPILNSPYDLPNRHFELGPTGPTGRIIEGRRPSESFIPVAPVRKGRGKKTGSDSIQEALTLTHEQVVRNTLIDELRQEVALWRNRRYDGVTPATRKLLEHWADPSRDNRVLFAQREAAETAIFLAEVSGRRLGYRDWRSTVGEQNDEHNAGLPRVALKMATGSGKTVVMAMLIAWHTLNKVTSPRDPRFVKRFLIVTPGVTIRDRLRVLQPNDPGNYYDQRDLIPADMKGLLGKAQILITNYHAFLLRDAKEIRGVSTTTRKILRGGRKVDPFKETDEAMVSRVLRGWGVGSGRKQAEILVLNDEAHHCYMDKPITVESDEDVETADAEAKDRNADARVWFKGLQAIARKVGVKAVYDLSATPFYLAGSGYKQGFIFPWVVSDFALMDAIESGIVKIPRIPVDDDADHDAVTYLNLWESIAKKLPGPRTKVDITDWVPPDELVGALHSLYRSYERAYDHWTRELKPLNHTPPVFIVVCPNTKVSKLVHDWIAGTEVAREDGSTLQVDGHLPLFANSDDGVGHAKPRTILVDSAQLESGEAMKKDFKAAAAAEIEAFKRELRLANPGTDLGEISDEDLLREVMNTVGKPGRLGDEVRCVVSVAMLTEGWDANTVSHVLGIRAFGSQLLCEQVVGRGLRRRSYDVNDEGRFEPEYANVYGVPFAFIPSDRPVINPKPPKPVTLVRTVEGRENQRITFPKLAGYRLEIPDSGLYLGDKLPEFVIGPGTVPSWTEAAPIVGEAERIDDAPESARPQTVAYHLAGRLLRTHYADDPQSDAGEVDHRPWLYPQLVALCRQWIDTAVIVEDGWSLGHLTRFVAWQARAADEVVKAINTQVGNQRARLRPVLRRYDPVGSTDDISFHTRKECVVTDPDRCQISHVVLDGTGGNTWEQLLMSYAEAHPQIAAYAKNDHLGFAIPYLYEGRAHDYVPDFLLRLSRADGEEFDRTLIVEVSGGQKRAHSPGSTELKALVARDQWCVAVNNHGGFGRWGYLEVTHMPSLKNTLDQAIGALYADGPIIGDVDRLDFQEVTHHAAP